MSGTGRGNGKAELCGADKSARCVLAHCPLAGSRDVRCGRCTGPVVWRDAAGIWRGCARSCSSCPMDGLGLPVCWAACPGPTDKFQTDGQSIVTLGGMPDSDAYLQRMAMRTVAEGGSARDRRDAARLQVLSGMIALDARQWDEFKAKCERGEYRDAARMLGSPMGAFRGADPGGYGGSPVSEIMERIGELDGSGWEAVRRIARGETQKRAAELGWVSKQAQSMKMKRLSARFEWIGRLMGAARRKDEAEARR